MTATRIIAGVDEAGRGPLAGPVVAAAVILNDSVLSSEVKDSKKLSQSRRDVLYEKIYLQATAVGVGMANVAEIDSLNILHATMLAMRRAVENLDCSPGLVLCDGNRCPEIPFPCEAIVGGDDKVPAISAASIIAKVTRDRIMMRMHDKFPQYRFDLHKGYPTKLHREALMAFGAIAEHRQSFAPVKSAIASRRQQNDQG